MSGQIFQKTKGLDEELDFRLIFTSEFAKTDPADQIASVVWSVTRGTVTLSNERLEGTDKALVRVSGGDKLYSWHAVKGVVTCVSGQVYSRTIEVQIVQ